MPATIVMPTEIEQTLYEGPLQLTMQVDRRIPGLVEDRHDHETLVTKGPGPVVTLGEPQCWNLSALAQKEGRAFAEATKMLLHDSDFYLLQLACSFRPERHSTIDWAEFAVHLESESGQGAPIAFDIFPHEISQRVHANRRVSITPSLKFSEGSSPGDPPPSNEYDIAAIRRLLRGAFTAKDLVRFCRDRPVFDPIVSHFGLGASLEDMIDVVIEQCRVHLLFADLLSEIKEYNPAQYQRYSRQLKGRGPSPEAGAAITIVECPRLLPVVYGFGVMEANPGWQFEMHQEQPLRGYRSGCLIVQKPSSVEAVRLSLGISATVNTGETLASATVSETDLQQLSTTVCRD